MYIQDGDRHTGGVWAVRRGSQGVTIPTPVGRSASRTYPPIRPEYNGGGAESDGESGAGRRSASSSKGWIRPSSPTQAASAESDRPEPDAPDDGD